MEFIWKMTEENWKNMKHDMNINNYNNWSKDYDFYGQMFVGDYCIEFKVVEGDAFTEIYQLFIDNNYAYEMTGNRYTTIDGTPYDLVSAQIDIPKADNFEGFKILCEKDFISKINIYFYKEFADKKCEWMGNEIHMNDY